MIAALLFAVAGWLPGGIWFQPSNLDVAVLCYREVLPTVFDNCVVRVGQEVDSNGIPSDVYVLNGWRWAGNPYCVNPATGMNLIATDPEAIRLNAGACRLREQPEPSLDSPAAPSGLVLIGG
jgi:hypothetical protein